MKASNTIKPFLEPRSVVVVGASRKGSSEGYFGPLEFMVRFNYPGKIYVINPSADEIFGVRSYPRIKDLPEDIDLAVITLPRHLLIQTVNECVESGIKAIIIYTQGLADADDEGKALQSEIVKLANAGGVRIIGPNTFGIINAFSNFHTAFIPIEPSKTLPLAVVSQSGVPLVRVFPNAPQGGQGAIGKGIDLGNTCDIDYADVLEYLEEDQDIKVIVLYIEGLREGRRFIEVAKRVAKRKPILALKGGKGEQGAKAAASHTGALAGKEEIYKALFKQCGIIEVEELDELDDFIKAFLILPPMKGKRIAVVSHIGFLCTTTADACEKYSMELAELSPKTVKKIKGLFPDWMPVKNPLDFWIAVGKLGYKEIYQLLLEAVLEDKGVDAVICSMAALGDETQALDPSEILNQAAAKFTDKPIVAFIYGWHAEKWQAEIEEKGRILGFTSADKAVKALSVLWRYKRFLREDKDNT